ncbi:hypothetical protein T4A_88 [Trichinella pseudospiralis]|uniref:Uncharacterized protein n=1 Tax=Trichinella pseudospiralis TaxID=6337 RepID=A0A0V1EGW4_TRIPS|nr:hypothetical protein T4A_88 [Trichinella pseudospiralis]
MSGNSEENVNFYHPQFLFSSAFFIRPYEVIEDYNTTICERCVKCETIQQLDAENECWYNVNEKWRFVLKNE